MAHLGLEGEGEWEDEDHDTMIEKQHSADTLASKFTHQRYYKRIHYVFGIILMQPASLYLNIRSPKIFRPLYIHRRDTKGRSALLPELEMALYQQFVSLRDPGSKVKVNWFLVTARVSRLKNNMDHNEQK